MMHSNTDRLSRTIVIASCYNESDKLKAMMTRYPADHDYDILVVDDGSTDGSGEIARQGGAIVARHEDNRGVGAALKTAFTYALENEYEIMVIMAGNNKDEPLEIPRLVEPIKNGEADFVQGSRFTRSGQYGNMPLYRVLATRFHALLFSLFARKWLTESTNGFRAIHRRVLEDPRIDWRQDWLDKYELEPYILFKTIKLGYRHLEAPCTKIYPPRELGQTKMRAFSGWWSILRPIFLLGLGLKK